MESALPSLADVTAALTAPGQMFELTNEVVLGSEATTWKNAPRTLRDVLDLSRRHAEREFLVYENQRVTFDEHFRIAATLAHRLRAVGLETGDRVAIASRNLPQWVMAFWGIVVAGAIAVPINAWWSTEELLFGITDSGSRLIFIDEERLERIRPQLDDFTDLEILVVVSDEPGRAARLGGAHPTKRIVSFDEFLGSVARDVELPDVSLVPDDDATIFYTSGTTGVPRGAVGTHRNATSSLMNVFFNARVSALRNGSASDEQVPAAVLLNIPLFHTTASLAAMTINTAAGGKIVMTHHFDAKRALKLIQAERITVIGGVPAIVMQILDHPEFKDFDTSSVRTVAYGGSPAPPSLVTRIRAHFPKAQPSNGYGMTETSAAVCQNTGIDYVARPESCGVMVPVGRAAIVPEGFSGGEPTDAMQRGSDAIGELWIKGPSVVRGYWQRPVETNETFSHGWVRTGDIARMDDERYLYLVDRAKDVIIRGGENVYPAVVEAALFEHHDVADCAVVGLPHDTLGEEVAAVVVLRFGRSVEAEELARHVEQRLAKFEVPTKFFFRTMALPRNPQGKILKRELRASLRHA